MAPARFIISTVFAVLFFIACSPQLKKVSVEAEPQKIPAVSSPHPESTASRKTTDTFTDRKVLDEAKAAPTEENANPKVEITQPVEKQDDPAPSEETQASPNGDADPKKPEDILEEALSFCQAAQEFWQKGEPENAIEALDRAYDLILLAEPKDDPTLSQQKEDLRFLISKRILEIYASRHFVANGKYNGIPLDLNSHVQSEIDSFYIGKEKDFFIESYRRSGKYRPFILEAFEEAGIPSELSWLPLIESGFKVNAFSKARALGLWQFISSTGYKFGLKRDTYIDERLDPVKSTKAAIAYLKELHDIFGDWTTAMAAYNCGENRVLRVIREQNVSYLDNFWDLYEKLPRETARYVPRFLATLHMVNNPKKYGLDAISVDPQMTFESATVSKQVHIRDVAEKIGVSESALKGLNPELRHQIIPPYRYDLRVPPGKKEALYAVVDSLSPSRPPRPAYLSHKVRKGETVSTIAKRYHVSAKGIMTANNINRSNRIVAGNVLKIPQKEGLAYQSDRREPGSTEEQIHHVVKAGDSLWGLAKKYGTTIENIRQLNGISGTELSTGQVLKISGRSASDSSAENLMTYKVRKGDTPHNIASRFNMTLEHFLSVNRLTPKSRIYPNQTLFVQ